MEGDSVVGPVDCVCRGKVVKALNVKTGKGPGLSDVSLKLIAASGEVGYK